MAKMKIKGKTEVDATSEVLQEKEEYRVNSSLTASSSKIAVDAGLIKWDSNKLEKILDKCMTFAESIAPNELYPYQKDPVRRIFRSVLTNDGGELTLLFARQSGKTELLSLAVASLLFLAPILYKKFPEKFDHFRRGIMIGVFAPTAEQCSTLHARVQSILTHDASLSLMADPEIMAKKKADSGVIEIKGGLHYVGKVEEAAWVSYAKFMSAAKQAKIESKSFHLIVTDETQEIDDMKILKSIHPMMAAYNGTIVKSGTPTTYICEFYNACLRNRTNDSFGRKGSTKNHYEYDYTIVQRYNKKYKAFVAKEIERYGKQSDYFQMSYGLKWLVEKGMALTLTEYNDYIAVPAKEIEESPEGGYTYVGGLDLGKDKDPSVLTIFKLYRPTKDSPVIKTAVRWIELVNKSWEEQFNVIVTFVKHYGLNALAVDSTGKGDPISEILTRMLNDTNCTLLRVNFSLKTKHTLATEFYEDLYNGLLKAAAGPKTMKTKEYVKFFTEMTSCIKTYKETYLQLEHPKDVPGSHDDYLDSFLLANYAARRSLTAVAKQEVSSFFDKKYETYDEKYSRFYEHNKIRINKLFKS